MKRFELIKDCFVEDSRNGRDVKFSEGEGFYCDEWSINDFNDKDKDRFRVNDEMNCDGYIFYKGDKDELWVEID